MINEILNVLYKNKTINIKIIKRDNLYSEYIIITTGLSKKHIKSLTTNFTKEFNKKKIFLSGKNTEWVIIDTENITIHLMLKETREFYDLESLYLKNY